MNMKLHKLLTYIEANFIEGIMQIMGQEFPDVGLTEADMRRYINVLAQEKIIDFKGTRYASSINPHTTGRTLLPTPFNPIPVFMFVANIELVKAKLKEYELPEKIKETQIKNVEAIEHEIFEDIKIEKTSFNGEIGENNFIFDDLSADDKKSVIVLLALIKDKVFTNAKDFIKGYKEAKGEKLRQSKVSETDTLLSRARGFLKEKGSKCDISSLSKDHYIGFLLK